MSNILDKRDELAEKNRAAYASAMADFRASFTLGEIVASKDTGCLTAVPANDNVPVELRALGAAIGRASDAVLPPVIALTGIAGSGKSTASKYLVEKHDYQLVKFAGPLKDMLRAVGLGEGHIEGAHKETGLAMLSGRTPRYAMQTLGTEWGRKCMGDYFWINLWRSRVDSALAFGGRVVVDDCRFPNEAAEVRALGGVVWQLVGRGGIAGAHESEAGCGQPDVELMNDGEMGALLQKIKEALPQAA
ncbi:putative deoxynucleotide monophosphate kinase [Agrobacterium tumefaciens str. Kerr 14]|uniref:Putative deoxynucleotide monophosphate kinase n=1 Tax=Agrobacterium tumefaciens str. Kerr 14 TaxID=1183424 RepID=A0A1S7NKY7_AGRTU|nr:deoxynucleotide monophosphate kinase [Agrobacterium tumefaciens]CUX08577.1 putative deoxynucleotide monophosphate kinase [Agrobacterium tumefaciens str. Kerr 14]